MFAASCSTVCRLDFGFMNDESFRNLVDSISARTATPGGGAVAGINAALGNALLLMVIRFSRGKKAGELGEEVLARAEETLEGRMEPIMELAERDCAAFDSVARAYGMPKGTPEEKESRGEAIKEGLLGAMVVPEETLAMVRDVLVVAGDISSHIGKNIVSDLGAASEVLRASAETAFLNVRINAAYLQGSDKAEAGMERASLIREEVMERHGLIRSAVEELL